MNKTLLFIAGALILVSCGTPKDLYNKGIAKIEKAIEKDSTLAFPLDTLRITEYDTIRGTDGQDSIIFVRELVEIPCDFDLDAFKEATRNKTRKELRFQRRMYNDSLTHERKIHRLDNQRYEDSLDNALKVVRELTKQIEDTNTKEEKLAKEETKQKKGGWFQRLAGRYWWILILIGFIGGLYVRQFIPKIPNPFKPFNDAQ